MDFILFLPLAIPYVLLGIGLAHIDNFIHRLLLLVILCYFITSMYPGTKELSLISLIILIIPSYILGRLAGNYLRSTQERWKKIFPSPQFEGVFLSHPTYNFPRFHAAYILSSFFAWIYPHPKSTSYGRSEWRVVFIVSFSTRVSWVLFLVSLISLFINIPTLLHLLHHCF